MSAMGGRELGSLAATAAIPILRPIFALREHVMNDAAGGKGAVKKVVLAYSGGLDTSVILAWLIETYGCEVIAFVADLGQGEELAPVRAKAKRTGDSRTWSEPVSPTPASTVTS